MSNIQRKDYLDVMRIIAIFFVIFNHCPGYTLYQISESGKVWLYMFITMITRINVPLFFMVSGALLLGKDESYEIIFKKRVLRFVAVITLFSLGRYLVNAYIIFRHQGIWTVTCKEYIDGTLAGSIDGTYWFLYAYLGMILMLPFLRKFCAKITKEDVLLLIGIHFIFSSLLPMLNVILGIIGMEGISLSGDLSIPLSRVKALFYPIIGYYIEYYVDIRKIKSKEIILLLGITAVGILLSCVFTYYEGINSGYTQNYVQLFDYLTAICVFIIVKKVCVEIAGQDIMVKFGRYINIIGTLTFGMYLLDPFLKNMFYNKLVGKMNTFLPVLLTSITWCIFSMMLGGVLTYIMKRIPVLKKIL